MERIANVVAIVAENEELGVSGYDEGNSSRRGLDFEGLKR